MEPVIEPLGFDWNWCRIFRCRGQGTGVSTLGVLYADDAEADAVSLGERIPITPLVAFGLYGVCIDIFPVHRHLSGH